MPGPKIPPARSRRASAPKRTPRPPVTKGTPAFPEWLATPKQQEEYQLTMWVDGASIQMVDVSRDEFLSLKLHLATLRGINVTSREGAVNA